MSPPTSTPLTSAPRLAPVGMTVTRVAAGISITTSVASGSYCVAQNTEAGDFGFEYVARFHELGRRAGMSDAGWCARADNVAGFERQSGGQLGDDTWNLEVHMTRARVLLDYAVHAAGDMQILRVLHFVGSSDPRPHR